MDMPPEFLFNGARTPLKISERLLDMAADWEVGCLDVVGAAYEHQAKETLKDAMYVLDVMVKGSDNIKKRWSVPNYGGFNPGDLYEIMVKGQRESKKLESMIKNSIEVAIRLNQILFARCQNELGMSLDNKGRLVPVYPGNAALANKFNNIEGYTEALRSIQDVEITKVMEFINDFQEMMLLDLKKHH